MKVLNERALYTSVFALIEHLGGMELTDTSKHLIVVYLEDALAQSMSGKARSAIQRYVQADVPTLTDIRERGRSGALSQLDHLVLKMEHAAARVR
jgi:hypothetical protein